MKVSTDSKTMESLVSRRVERVAGNVRARLAAGKPLRIKLGVDPTAPDLHLGHAVQLRKLREFQDAGHKIVLIIGDHTARIGDPTGKSKTRPPLTKKDVDANAKTYLAQAGKIINLKKTEVRRNSEWFAKMKMDGVLALAGQFTVARMIERDDFAKRLKEGTEIHLHELLYPMMQAYDSVMVKADIEIGGTDQMFNILAGRELQKKMGQPEQDCLFLGPILVGTDGEKKMSKSLNNYVGLAESSDEMFGKVMSIPDSVIRDWFRLTTDITEVEIAELLVPGKNPRAAKVRLAKEIIVQYHSAKAAAAAEEHFNSVFQKKEIPDDIAVRTIKTEGGHAKLVDILTTEGLFGIGPSMSRGEARRLIDQGGVKVDGVVIRDVAAEIVVLDGEVLIQKGKRHFVKIVAK